MNMFREILSKFDPEASVHVTDESLIASFTRDPDFPYLVSFPRTGSHWLRLLMELYFEKPSLVRIFYYRDQRDFTCYHTHDEALQVSGRGNVLYLYRDPIDTVYSQLSYYKEDISDTACIDKWSELYANHLVKWLFDESWSKKKTVLSYEGLKRDLDAEFGKLTSHFGVELDAGRLAAVAAQVTKSSLKKKTAHDKQVVNLDAAYGDKRERFRTMMGARIQDHVLAIDGRLAGCFR
jgi:hypothetical protein